MSLRLRVLPEQDPDCAFCRLDGALAGAVGYFVAGIAYGLHEREIPICKDHLPVFQKDCKDADHAWDAEITH